MNRKSLINLLRANGYTEAAPTLESVKSHITKIAAEGVEINGQDGKPIDVDAVWNTKSTITLEGDNATDAMNSADRKAVIKAAKGTDSPHTGDDENAPQRFSIGNMETKSFNAKASRGETHLPDADTAGVVGSYFRLAALGREGYSQKSEDVAVLRKAAVSYDFSGGGFTVPDVLSTMLIDIKPQYSAIRTMYGGLMPISPAGESVPRRTGGVTVYSPGEGVAATVSEPAGDQVKLTPFEMVALAKPTRTLLSRSNIQYGDFIAREMAYAIDKKFEEIVLSGDGTSTYFNQVGMIGRYSGLVTDAGGTWTTNADYAASIVVAAGATWASITYQNVADVIARPLNVENPLRMTIVCSRPFYYGVLVPLASSKGGVTRAEVINGVSVPMYEGYPVIFSNAMPQQSATASVVMHLADWGLCSKVAEVPGTMTVETSTERFWDERKIGYQISVQRALNMHDLGNASSTAASRVAGPIASLITA